MRLRMTLRPRFSFAFFFCLVLGWGATVGASQPGPVDSATAGQGQSPLHAGGETGLEDLISLSIEELISVKVASKRKEEIHNSPAVVSILPEADIRTFGASNLLTALNWMPSVYTTGTYLFPDNIVSIRGDLSGAMNNHTLILINGRPVRESLAGGLNYPILTAFPVEMVKRVELVRGPGSVLYGTNAYTGVINIVPKEAEEATFRFAAEGGSFGYVSTSASGGAKLGEFNFYGAAKFINEDGWKFEAVDETGAFGSMHKGQRSAALATHMTYGPLSLDLFYVREELNHMGKAPIWSLPGQEIDTDRLFADLGYDLELHERWHLTSHVGFNYSDFTWEEDAERRKSLDTLGEITLFGSPIDELSLLGGVIVEYQSAPDLSNSSIVSYSRVPLSAYFQADIQPAQWVRLTGGFQWNKPEDGDSDFNTRFATVVNVTPKWGFKFLRGEAFRAPWPVETDIANPVLTGNPDLSPETITTYDGQVFYHDEKAQTSVTGFYSKLKGQIVRVPNPGGGFTFTNGGDTELWGVELEGRYAFTPRLYALGSVTHQESKEAAGVRSNLAPNTMAKFGLGYHDKRWLFGLFYTFFKSPPGMPGAAEVNPSPEDVHWLSLNMNVELSDLLGMEPGSVALTARGENLLDQEVHHPEFNRRRINSLPAASGIAAYGGLRFNF